MVSPERVICFIVTSMDGCLFVVFLVSVVSSLTLSMDVPEFQYPCYADVCTFPKHYCNSDKFERRCSPCSRAICQASNVPLACRYICMKYDELTTTPKSAIVTTQQQPHYVLQGNDGLASLHLILSYNAVSITLLVVVLLSALAYYIHRKRESKEKEKRTGKDEASCDQNERLIPENDTCPTCGQRPRPETQCVQMSYRADHHSAPPSYNYDQMNNEQLTTRTGSTGSADSGNSNTNKNSKRQIVRPLKQENKINNLQTTYAEINPPNISQGESSSVHLAVGSLIDGQTRDDTEQTSLKSSVNSRRL